MEISQKMADEEERYHKEMEKCVLFPLFSFLFLVLIVILGAESRNHLYQSQTRNLLRGSLWVPTHEGSLYWGQNLFWGAPPPPG